MLTETLLNHYYTFTWIYPRKVHIHMYFLPEHNFSALFRYMQRATLVQPEDEVSGELLFSAAAVYFVGNSDYENEGVAGSSSETGSPGSVRSSSEAGKPLVSLSWKMSALREVHRRWYQVR